MRLKYDGNAFGIKISIIIIYVHNIYIVGKGQIWRFVNYSQQRIEKVPQ